MPDWISGYSERSVEIFKLSNSFRDLSTLSERVTILKVFFFQQLRPWYRHLCPRSESFYITNSSEQILRRKSTGDQKMVLVGSKASLVLVSSLLQYIPQTYDGRSDVCRAGGLPTIAPKSLTQLSPFTTVPESALYLVCDLISPFLPQRGCSRYSPSHITLCSLVWWKTWLKSHAVSSCLPWKKTATSIHVMTTNSGTVSWVKVWGTTAT